MKKLNNDNLAAKIDFRRRHAVNSPAVLDLFAGQNEIWKQVPHSVYFGVDKKFPGEYGNLIADSYRVAPWLDLSPYDIIDVDCYGLPWRMLSFLKKNPTLRKGVRFFLTCISFEKTKCNEESPMMSDIRRIFRQSRDIERLLLEAKLRLWTDEYEIYEIDNGTAFTKRYITFVNTKIEGKKE